MMASEAMKFEDIYKPQGNILMTRRDENRQIDSKPFTEIRLNTDS